ncbi:MAG TPA: hypothetical protein VIQ03_16475 [Gammaproteobacteria bacterium]
MKKILALIALIGIFPGNSQAVQQQVVRLHVSNGLFNLNSPIGSGGGYESSTGAFVLDSGIYQGDVNNIMNDYIVTWQFGYFGSVYNFTAPSNPEFSYDAGGPPPSGFVDDTSNTIVMDLSSWFAWWNGIVFNQGSPNATGTYDPATGIFILNWSKLIVGGPFSGTTGYWQLTGFVEVTDGPVVFIPIVKIDGARNKECNEHGGTTVTAHLTTSPGDVVISNITWFLDDIEIASNAISVNTLVPLGTHTIRADVTLDDGQTKSAVDIVTVSDTKRPNLDVAFIDSRSGEEVTSITSNAVHWITASIIANDACDPSPVIFDNMGGFNVDNGSSLKIQGNNNTVQLTTDILKLQASAKDNSNHRTSSYAELLITP